MKILVLNGSPKRDKSDTMHITRAFLDGMNEIAENEVHTINVIDKHIEYCTGCFACMLGGGDCIHHDDMRGILEEILNSDPASRKKPKSSVNLNANSKSAMKSTGVISGHYGTEIQGRASAKEVLPIVSL